MENQDQIEIGLKKVLLRTFNKNQILILSNITNDSHSINFVLKKIFQNSSIPLSTLKLNAKILKELGWIIYGNNSSFKKPQLTKTGQVILESINPHNGDENVSI
jgi:predicted transcriptional regulator